MPRALREALGERILVFDGAMGTSLQSRGLSAIDFAGLDGCNEILVQTRPDVVASVHADYFEAGADAVETDTFGGSAVVLAEYGLADRAYELNREAALLARSVAVDYSTSSRPRWVVGSIGPTTKLPSLGHISFAEMKEAFRVQAQGLVDGGVDALLVETCQDLLQAKIALIAVFEVLRERGADLPVMVQVTIEATGTMLLGTEVAGALAALANFPVAAIGMNCATGPAQMTEHIRFLCENSPLPVSCLPNAGIPENVGGRAVYRTDGDEFAAALVHFARDFGVSVVGGCCGTTAEHIRALAEAVDGLRLRRRHVVLTPAASSLFMAQPFQQDTSFLIVGERVNASGSKRCRELLLADDWDGLTSLAREQVREGAHVLDVNVDYVGRDGVRDMDELVSRLATSVTIPLMFDSTDWQKMESGLRRAGGKCILNSTNFEDGEERFGRVCRLAREYGAALVIGTIDEEGMARTAARKMAIATRGIERATRDHGIAPPDLFIDPLALPISTGNEEDRRNAAETIEALRRLKAAFPEVNTILGVSNISFGLAPEARRVLNSVFLHEAVAAGLDAAIVHAGKILPLNRIAEDELRVARQLIYDEREFSDGVCQFDPLGEFTRRFAGVVVARDKASIESLPIEQRLQRHIVDGEKLGLEAALDEALGTYTPLAIINQILLEGMRKVGELFGNGRMQLPFVLQSAEVMKAAVRYLEPRMEKVEGSSKGTIVLATVKGDVHDIGKNLVDIILTNNGYRVINLGIKQPIDTILAAAEEHGADAIGMSGLLVKSTVIMKENLELMVERGVRLPVVLGGAALTRRYVEEDLRPLYGGRLEYANDAFAGLHFMDRLAAGVEAVSAPAAVARPRKRRAAASCGGAVGATGPALAVAEVQVPAPPFYGTRVVADIPLEEVFPYINEVALFRGQWQIRRGSLSREEYELTIEETVRPSFERLKKNCLERKLLEPKVVYGYYPCQSEGNDIIVYDEQAGEEVARFTFPRQSRGRQLCLADFFAPRSSGVMDVAAFHLVTVGAVASRHAQRLFQADAYSDYLYFHGLAVETAEALAEYWHKQIRVELGIAGDDADEIPRLFQQAYRGARFSFGYPASPRLEDQSLLFKLLDPSRIGVKLTEEFQLEPEQSTTAIIAHHPGAHYFTVE